MYTTFRTSRSAVHVGIGQRPPGSVDTGCSTLSSKLVEDGTRTVVITETHADLLYCPVEVLGVVDDFGALGQDTG